MGIQSVVGRWEAAAGEILAVAHDFGTTERNFGTTEEIFRIPERTVAAAGNERRSLSVDGVDGTMKRGPPDASFFHRGG